MPSEALEETLRRKQEEYELVKRMYENQQETGELK
jgi:hypothetical protein